MKQIDQYIKRERELDPSPSLPDRIIARLEQPRISVRYRRWEVAAIAASLLLALFLGITLGSVYQPKSYLSVNDNQIENFQILLSDDDQ